MDERTYFYLLNVPKDKEADFETFMRDSVVAKIPRRVSRSGFIRGLVLYRSNEADRTNVYCMVVDGEAPAAEALDQRRLADLGQEIPPRNEQMPEALSAYHRAEIEKWRPMVKAAGIKPE